MQNQHHPEDLWGWDGELTPVPGFGFFPEMVNTELDAVTKEILQQEISVIPDLQICNLSSAFIGQYKCTILNETWPYLFPDLSFKSQVTTLSPAIFPPIFSRHVPQPGMVLPAFLQQYQEAWPFFLAWSPRRTYPTSPPAMPPVSASPQVTGTGLNQQTTHIASRS